MRVWNKLNAFEFKHIFSRELEYLFKVSSKMQPGW